MGNFIFHCVYYIIILFRKINYHWRIYIGIHIERDIYGHFFTNITNIYYTSSCRYLPKLTNIQIYIKEIGFSLLHWSILQLILEY